MSRDNYDHITDDVLHEYLDGELNSEDRSNIQLHLTSCKECTLRLETWGSLFTEIERLPDLEELINFEPLVLANLSDSRPRRSWAIWMLIGQATLAISLIFFGWQQISTSLPLGRITSWLALPIQTLREMIDNFILGFGEAFNQFHSWSPSSGDLIAYLPPISVGGRLLIYAWVFAIALWMAGNHYLFRFNGQHEDTRPRI